MGKYVNITSTGIPLPSKGKAQALVEDGAIVIPEPEEWREGIICVVDNGPFEAAGYAYSPEELEVFKRPDGRPKVWLYHTTARHIAD